MATKAAPRKAPPEKRTDFAITFNALRPIIAAYAKKQMRVVHDTPEYYCIETEFPVLQHKSVMFAAVRKGKGYVSYHLVPLYMNALLQAKVSAELKRRQQGKACFNFVKPDEKLFAELAELTKQGFEDFKKLSAKA